MAIGRSTFAELLSPEWRKVYIEVGKQRPTEYDKMLNIVDMMWNPETDLQISGLGTMPGKPEGTQFTRDQPQLGGQNAFLAVPYGIAVEFTYEFWRDELYGIARELAAQMAIASHNRMEVQGASLFNNAFNTSFTGFTASESLCSTSHARIDGGTAHANRPSPDIQLSVTGLQNAITRFETQVDERGIQRLLAPSQIVIPPALKFTAREILGSAGKVGTADNEINAVIEDDLSVFVHHYFTSATQWFMLSSKENHDLQMRFRDRPVFDAWDDPNSKNAILSSYQRHTEGWSSWRGVDGSTG
jgi:hypothetical protein